jgi:glyoxylase-like metal-dependent hydrolase (beta-lactamase superfamily II)
MNVTKILDGLWVWTVPHPAWKPEFDRPDGWSRTVGSVYFESDSGVVLIDPLVPADPAEAARFWDALDRDVTRLGGRAVVLIGSVDHGRSADAVAERLRGRGVEVSVLGEGAIREGVSCRLDAGFESVAFPAGVRALSVPGISPGETAFFLEAPRAVVFADAVIGAGGGKVRVAPASWGVRTEEGQAHYARAFRAALSAVAALSPEILLPSHGEPALANGAAALAEALAAPPWGVC